MECSSNDNVIQDEENVEKVNRMPSSALIREAGTWEATLEEAEEFLSFLEKLFKVLETDKTKLGKAFERFIDHKNAYGLLLEDVRGDCNSGLSPNEDPEAARFFAKRLWLKYDEVRKAYPSFQLPDRQVAFRAMVDLAELPSDWCDRHVGLVTWLSGEDQAEEVEIPAPAGGLQGPYEDHFVNPQKYYYFELQEAYQAHGWDRVPNAAARVAMKTGA